MAYQHNQGVWAEGVTALDIGGGTGLLSMFAAAAGARHVYCCEMNPHLADIARKCIATNGFTDRITVIAKHSKDIQVGVDIPQVVIESLTHLMIQNTCVTYHHSYLMIYNITTLNARLFSGCRSL